jgi:hypothetical protein
MASKYITDKYTVRNARTLCSLPTSGSIETLAQTCTHAELVRYAKELERTVNNCNKSRAQVLSSELNLKSTIEEQKEEIIGLKARLAQALADVAKKTQDVLQADVKDVLEGATQSLHSAIERMYRFSRPQRQKQPKMLPVYCGKPSRGWNAPSVNQGSLSLFENR